MKLTALYYDETKRRHWIVRWLRFLGYCLIIPSELAAITFGSPLVMALLGDAVDPRSPFAQLIVLIVCGVGGFLAGIILGLPWWGLSLLLDDLHAIRLQTAAYVTHDQEVTHAD